MFCRTIIIVQFDFNGVRPSNISKVEFRINVGRGNFYFQDFHASLPGLALGVALDSCIMQSALRVRESYQPACLEGVFVFAGVKACQRGIVILLLGGREAIRPWKK